MKKVNKLLILILAFIIFLSLAEIALCNSLPDKGREVEEIEQEIKALEEENQGLHTEVARGGSLLKIMEKAEEAGFKKPRVVYFKKDAEIAFER